MFEFKEFKKRISSYQKGKGKNKKPITEGEKRIIFLAITVIIFLVAISVLLIRTAASSSGVAACNGIVFSVQRYQCFGALSNKTENYSICSFIQPQSSANSCIANIAESKGNVSICNNINSSNSQYNICVEQISYSESNINYCLMLKGNNESDCAYMIANAEMFDSINDCNLIANSSLKALCSYTYDYNSALKSNAPSYCSLLPNTTNDTLLSNILYKNSTNQSNSNPDNFFYSVLNVTPRSFCYYKSATYLDNQSLCGLTNGPISSFCYSSFTNATNSTFPITNESSLCASAPSYVGSICLYAVSTAEALSQKNASYCLSIQDKGYQYSCLSSLASKYNDSSYCSYIQDNSSVQQACIESIGTNLTAN